jgi:hypothetical protein
MLRLLAILFGIVFIVIGALGFFPNFVEQGNLLGIFRVNFEHNAAHIALGIIGVLSGLASSFASKTYFIIAGVVYALLAIFGFMEKSDMLFDMIAINTADNILHLALGAVFLLLGLGASR